MQSEFSIKLKWAPTRRDDATRNDRLAAIGVRAGDESAVRSRLEAAHPHRRAIELTGTATTPASISRCAGPQAWPYTTS